MRLVFILLCGLLLVAPAHAGDTAADPAIAICNAYAIDHVLKEPGQWNATGARFDGATVTIDYVGRDDRNQSFSHSCTFTFKDGRFVLEARTPGVAECREEVDKAEQLIGQGRRAEIDQAGIADCVALMEKAYAAAARVTATNLAYLGIRMEPGETRLRVE